MDSGYSSDVRSIGMLVKIDPPLSVAEEENEALQMYLENTLDLSDVTAKFSPTRRYAIVRIESVTDGIDAIQEKLINNKKKFPSHAVTVSTVPVEDKILVRCHVGVDEAEVVLLYFESARMCPTGGEVEHVEVLPCGTGAVVQFKELEVAKRVVRSRHVINDKPVTVETLDVFSDVEKLYLDEFCSREDGIIHEDAAGKKADNQRSDSKESEGSESRRGSVYEDAQSHHETDSTASNRSDDDEEEDGDAKSISKPKARDNDDDIVVAGDCVLVADDDGAVADGRHEETTSETKSSGRRTRPLAFFELLKLTHKCKQIPGLGSDDHDMLVANTDDTFTVIGTDRKSIDRVLDELEKAEWRQEVALSNFVHDEEMVAKLSSGGRIKWMRGLLKSLEIPAVVKKDKSGDKETVFIQALTEEVAKKAGKTINRSLLSARVKIGDSRISNERVSTCLRELDKKTIIIRRHKYSSEVRLFGIPFDVIEAVRKIEKVSGSSY